VARLPFPDVPPGPLRKLLEELHKLHARAGWPSTRELARGQQFSHTAVHDLFTKVDHAPKLPVLLAVVDRLAALAPRAHAEETLDRFDALWWTQLEEAETPFDPRIRKSSTHDSMLVLNRGVLNLGRPKDQLDVLTERELEVLALVAAGMRNEQIARQLQTTPATISGYNAAIYSKLGITSQGVLAREEVGAIFRQLRLHGA
jgi:DNA-binding CsgD family transcriptional regulator